MTIEFEPRDEAIFDEEEAAEVALLDQIIADSWAFNVEMVSPVSSIADITGAEISVIGGDCDTDPTQLPGLMVCWDQVSPPVGTAFMRYEIRRRIAGEAAYTTIAFVTDIATLCFTDFCVASKTTYEYSVRWRVSAGPAQVVSDDLDPGVFDRVDFDFLFLHLQEDSGTFVRLDTLRANKTRKRTQRELHVWGRTAPTIAIGEQIWHTITVPGLQQLLGTSDGVWPRLMDVQDGERSFPSVICARFGRAEELYFCQSKEIVQRQGERSYTPDLQLIEVEFDIGGSPAVVSAVVPDPLLAMLLFEGGVIEDSGRTASGDGATEGDGLPKGSGVGPWVGATNLITNEGMETNKDGWTVITAATLTRVLTEFFFGVASLEVIVAAAGRGAQHGYGGAANTEFTMSGRFKIATGVQVLLREWDDIGGFGANTTINGNDDWQYKTLTITTTAGSSTFRWTNHTNGGAAATFYDDGVQVELGPIATPLIHTDGQTESRLDARIRATLTDVDFDPARGAEAIRLVMGHDSADITSGYAVVWRVADDDNNMVELRYNYTAARWEYERASGGASTTVTVADTFAVDDEITLVSARGTNWIDLSLDGAGFPGPTANTTIPTLAFNQGDIGSNGGSSEHINSNVRWFVWMGEDVSMNDVVAAAFGALPSTPPAFNDLPGGIDTRAIWQAVDETLQTFPVT